MVERSHLARELGFKRIAYHAENLQSTGNLSVLVFDYTTHRENKRISDRLVLYLQQTNK